jgi:serine/threonine-protein kinase
VLASKYRLEELLGSGGMGHVYRAVNVEIDRAVAIKVLRAEHATNPTIVERFLREARAANLVRHPNVVDVVDIGRDADGSPFIVQELLTGEDFSKYVERRGGKLTLEEIAEYLLPVIDAVAEAHAKGVVHRDVKPENVFLAVQGRKRVPKLLDFGISKVRLPNIKTTEVGVMMGTPAYMAPEQIQGSRDADPRSDVWAFGIMLFELLAGRLPFDADDAPALFVAVATKDVPPLTEVIPDVEPRMSLVVERCLRRLPDDRYPSALELARDLRHVLEDGELELEPTQRHPMAPRATSHHQPVLPDLVPDLALPSREKRQAPPAAKTLPRPSRDIGTNKTELSIDAPAPRAAAPPASSPNPPLLAPQSDPRAAAPPASSPNPPLLAPQSDPRAAAPPASSPYLHVPAPQLAPRAPSSARLPAVAASVQTLARPGVVPPPQPTSAARTGPESLPGVMLAATTSGQHRPAGAYLREAPRQGASSAPDMTLLIALAVVGLTAIGVTAVLMTFAYQPEGWPLLSMVMKPPPMAGLVVHGGLGLVAVLLAARFSMSGVKKWRGHVEGGRGASVLNAILAGGFFFAALQLARAAW